MSNLNQELSQSLDPSEVLKARLYALKQPSQLPKLLPESNPQFPKKPATVLRGGQAAASNAHFSQIKNQQVAKANSESSKKQDERLIITSFIKPFEAIKRLKNAPEGTFFYMQRADKLDQGDMFQYFICPHQLIDVKDYYTISSTGVAHISNQNQSFTPLQEWLDELLKLEKLRKISIFKNFRIWKPLYLLKKAVPKNRRVRSIGLLQQNLFTVNQFLRQSLFVVLECTDGIRSLKVIQTDQYKGKRSQNLLLKQFQDFNYGKQVQIDDENASIFHQDSKVHVFPFTIDQFDALTLQRCTELSELFDSVLNIVSQQTRQSIDQTILMLFAQNNDDSDDEKVQKTVKTAISYTERASRMNACKRMLNYLRLTDFMLMDSLYDFAFGTLEGFKTKMTLAGEEILPENIIASQAELLQREKEGLYRFGDEEVGEDIEEFDEDALSKVVGSSKNTFFLGSIICQSDHYVEPKSNLFVKNDSMRSMLSNLSNLSNASFTAPVQNKVPVGPRDLRIEDDQRTPGNDVGPGQQASIVLTPSTGDFQRSFEGFTESVLSVETSVRRLMNHEEFADVSLPVISGDVQLGLQDGNKLALLQEINAPDLSILFTSNVGFSTLLQDITNLLKVQYDNALNWSKCLQPFYDAYNDCVNLDIGTIENKLFGYINGSWAGPARGKDAQKEYLEYLEEYNKLQFRSVKDDNNIFQEFQSKILDIEFKEILAQTGQYSSLKIKNKNDVPLTIFTNLTKITMQEVLISDAEFNELLNKMEHYRRLHYSMPEQVNLQLFSFDLTNLKKSFMPVSQRILDYLKVAIPLSVFKRLFVLQANIILLQKYLNNIPQQIQEFIVYKDVVMLIQEEVIDNIKTISDNSLQLLNVCVQHSFKIPKEVNLMQQLFLQNFEVFKQQVNFIEGGLDSHVSKQLDILSDQCKVEFDNLQNLATQMRLKSLNRTVELFTLSDMSQFFNIYMKEFIQRKDQQTEIQNQLTIALSKQEKVGTFPELENEIQTLKAQILPDYMMMSPSKLTYDFLISQHNYYLENKEVEEEESEEDGLGEEIQEEEEEQIEVEKEEQEEGAEENEEQSRQSLDETQKQDIQKLLEKEIPPHLKLSNIFIHLKHRTEKTNFQRSELDLVEAKIKTIQKYQSNLGSEQTDFPLLEKVAQHIRQYDNLWSASLEFQKEQLNISRQNFFGDLDHEILNQLVANIGKTAFQCERSILSSEMPGVLKQRVTELRQIIPIVQSLDNPALKERHWQEVGNALNIQVPMQIVNKAQKDEKEVPVISINWLVFNKALVYKDQLSQVSSNAANEQNLEAAFNKVNLEWQTIDLLIKPHASIGDIFILYDTADLIAKLDDSLLVVQGIASSKYAKPIQDEVNVLLKQLSHLSTCLDVFLKVQKGYLYLLNIFASSDIQRQLPNESKMFLDLDSFWKKLMQKIYEYPQALKVTNYQISQRDENSNPKISVLESQLRRYEQILDQIQKSLDDFLQTKRMAFPRLFFISDDELLDLLALAKNPLQLNQHMRKLFENVVSVDMFMNQQAGGLEISALNSEEGEKMTLIQTVKPRGSMTVWLTTLEQKMKQTVAKSIKTAIESFKEYKDRGQWILSNHAQSVIAGSCTFWCANISEALDGTCDLREMGFMKNEEYDKKQNALSQYLQRYESDLQGLIVLIKGGLNKLQRCSVTALATIETHNRDTIQVLLNQRLTTTEDFEFQKLLRYYYNLQDPDVPLLLKQNTTILPYQNEYLGASPRLVITPLTDLVYLHIACAVQNSKAINLSGPAGTGKSETTKDQNKARGNACVVFNCSDNVEVYVMNRFFMGFCMTGAGSCLDEFNRLELSLLSVIAGSIKQILDGLKMARNGGLNGPFLFQGYEIQLNPDTIIAISLNPGYAGRAELPQNLKNLFRTFSMVVPDYSLISEIILFSQGFTQAKPLSRKVVQLYKLSSEQLSQSNSYDFGMRGTKSVLSMAGNLRRKFEDQSEEQVLIRAMQDSNLPRMEADDRDLFMGIINDLFPNEQYVQQPNQDLQKCIERSLREHNLQVNQVVVQKINQLFETSQIRHGVLMMGPAKSGKTVSLNTMTEALGYLREIVNTQYSPEDKKIFDSNFPMSVVNKTQTHLINSKAITINEIYGAYDDVSGEWKDGLLGNIMRTCLSDTKDADTAIKQFILFDSHVSTEWIETMNSLLDDSKLLCLANSERLKINDYISILFECESLKHASPATVSRLGILFYPECTLADTLQISAIHLRPQNFKSLTDDEKAELDAKVLKHAVTKSLEQQIVRWDHIVISWLDSEFDQLFLFKSLKDAQDEDITTKCIEMIIYEKLKGLFVKLMAIFVPIGLKYASTVRNLYINTNEYQLVNQILLIFGSLLKYNRSMSAQSQLDQQEELDKFATENGLADAQKAEDSPIMDQLDFSVFIRFLTLQFLYRNQIMLSQPPSEEEVIQQILDFILQSEEFKQVQQLIKNLFMFSFIWSFGGTLAAGNKQNREDFDALIRLQIELQNENLQQLNLKLQQGELQEEDRQAPFEKLDLELPLGVNLSLIPNQGTVFDYYLDWQPFLTQQFEILASFAHLPIYHGVGQVCPRLVNAGSQKLPLLFYKSEDIIMNFSTVAQIFASGIEEQQELLQCEVLQLPVQFTSFAALIPAFTYNPNLPFSSLFINTQDTVRYQHFLESLMKNGNHILLTGASGSGKTSVLSSLLSSLDARLIIQNIQINFSARTSSLRIQQILEDTLEKRRKNLLGPIIGKKGIIYIDDLNLPAKDIYECSQPIEFIRFLLDTDGFYDRKELFFKKIQDTKILASCAPPGGGRESLTTRLTTSFILINQPESEDDSLIKIYDQILSSHLNYYKYNSDIISSSTGIVKALIAIYHNLSGILKPTPSKMHYSFTLRDVSKVVQGLLRAPKTIIKQTDDFISLFRHEILRVFGDRTVNSFDRERVCKQIVDVLNTQSGTGLKKALVYESCFDDEGIPLALEIVPQNPQFLEMWGDYMRMGTPLEERVYEQSKDFKTNSALMYQYLDSYNESGAQKMNLILFEDAVFYINKIAKILSTERGNLMNVGVGGSGRKSLTRLAAFMCEFEVESIQLKKGYSQQDFHDDVKKLYLKAGLQGKNIVFLLDESQLVSEAILEDINNILNSGLISNLFEADEMDQIMTTTRTYINDNNLSDIIDVGNKASVFNFFINRVRDKLHLVLCLSPSGEEFRARLRTFPSLLTCMSIVWFHPWPQTALQDVSLNILKEKLKSVDFSSITGNVDTTENQNFAKKLAIKLAPLATEIHSNTEKLLQQYYMQTNRRHYLPPATFLDLLNIYCNLLQKRIAEIATKYTQLQTGVIKLIDAKDQVDILQLEQEALKPELEKSTISTNELIQQVDKEAVQVNQMRQTAMSDAAIVAAQTKECEMMASDAQKELDACEPIIQMAIKALDSINAGDIAEMKRVSSPTKLVKMVIESIAILLGCKTDWASCQQMLGQNGFIKVLQQYDKDNISDQMLKKLKVYTQNEDFEPAKIEKVSLACKSLSLWVVAVEKYSYVNREVEPKRQRLQKAKTELDQKQAVLKEKQDNLAKVEAQFQILTDTLNTNKSNLDSLQKQMELTKQRLDRAEKLTSALGDERVRWVQQSGELKESLQKVIGDVFLAACGVCYFGVFTSQFRTKLMSYWFGLLQIYNIQTSPSSHIEKGIFNLVSSDEMQVEIWKEFGLPNDQQSIDNAVIIQEILDMKWPLLIDPQNQGSNFIKELEASNQVMIIRPTQPGIVRKFEAAIRGGIPILLDGVSEKLDPSLQPIIERQFTIDNGKQMVKLGDQPVEVHPNFRLYITTKLMNPKYSPETHAKLQIINFSIAVDALQQQILGEIITLEYPDLEKARAELTAESSTNKKLLTKLAGQILHELSSFQGSVLDNEGLIQVLNESKATSQAIQEKEIASASTREKISQYYKYYMPVAIRTSLIYFLISDMSLVEQMYLFSLSYYKQLVLQEVSKVEEHRQDTENIENRVIILIEKLTFNLFTGISRGLFEKDKFVFAFLLGCRILQNKGDIQEEEWGLFTKGAVYADIYNQDINKKSHQTETKKLLELLNLQTDFTPKLIEQIKVMCQVPYMWDSANLFLQQYINIRDYIKQDRNTLNDNLMFILTMDNTSKTESFQFLIEAFKSFKTTAFQRLLFVKLLADEYFFIVLPTYIEIILDTRFANIKPQPLKQLYLDSTQFAPVLFIISEGVDPVASTQLLAEEYKKFFHIISLGKGQTPGVRQLLKTATQDGSWIFLQNVHLAQSDFLPELEIIIESLSSSKQGQTTSQLDYLTLPPNPGFRLYLSSTPVDYFPQSVLQASLKCTTEPPSGMKNNLLRQFNSINEEKFNLQSIIGKMPQVFDKNGIIGTWKRIVFSCMFFHSNLLERKKFGPQGYNLHYDFNDTDIEMCLLQLEDFFLKEFKRPSDILQGLFISLDWSAVEFIFGAIHYGGKVNDSWDKRTVATILRKIITDKIVKEQDGIMQPYSFVDQDDRYSLSFIDHETKLQDVINKLQNLPPVDQTMVFGMSENSAVVNQQSETSRILDRVLSVSADCVKSDQQDSAPKVEKGQKEVAKEGEEKLSAEEQHKIIKDKIKILNIQVFGVDVKSITVDEIVDNIASNLLNKLPQPLDINEANPKSITFDENNVPHCLTTILKQEMERFNQLLDVLKQTLTNVKLAIKGDVILSSDLESIYKSLYDGKVPVIWGSIAYPSLKPLAPWFEDLILRVVFARSWLTKGRPMSFWLSGLYFPQGFCTALLQTHARKHKIAVDSLKFDFNYSNKEWSDFTGPEITDDDMVKDATWIHGLFLDCGYFDLETSKLVEPKLGILYPKLPYIRFLPVEQKNQQQAGYISPVYRTSQRAGVLSSTGHSTNFVLPLIIPSEFEEDRYVRLGTAALCGLDY
ncbi:Dynein heavy chain [Spironucleus salmonicida]|uniref:Dynein heavy chain n=1 Tax=Spironucleus salmonicida TaxID=348837 RepID=V6LR57_9EUKA|nr:Dynein heavy chain [Spironucleus salmonicida]|eukprot:EST46166.1 Dynein heavy chain [Spironucleus salmonicida]